jgi:hypothetical protein
MAMLTLDCARCGERQMTHDVVACSIHSANGQHEFEYFMQCRACNKSTVWGVSRFGTNATPDKIMGHNGPANALVTIGQVARARGGVVNCPAFTPTDLKLIFDEAAECMSINAWNAASAMFRKIVDQISKDKMAAAPTPPPDNRTRFNLKPRLEWLFANGLLPLEIQPLANAIREDGNDGVHNAPLGKDDALDVQDFTVELLERLYTMPGRLQEAEARRAARRANP